MPPCCGCYPAYQAYKQKPDRRRFKSCPPDQIERILARGSKYSEMKEVSHVYGQFGVDWEERIDFEKLRKGRLARRKKKMKEHAIDALLTFRPENIRYATSYRPLWWPTGMAVTRNASILTRDQDSILYVASGDWARAVATMPWLKRANIRPLAVLEDLEVFKTTVEEFKKELKSLGVADGTIGIDATRFGLTQQLQKALPKAAFVDGDEVFA